MGIINGEMEENTEARGKIIRWTVEGYLNGAMGSSMEWGSFLHKMVSREKESGRWGKESDGLMMTKQNECFKKKIVCN